MEYLFGIIILLGALIFFHEFGHFIVAKWGGVKVEVFSLGFGPKILKKKIGETQYCLSIIPLGGYVKLYGEDPTEAVTGRDAKRSFSNQPVSKRIAIAAAGPGFNILFAIIIYFVIEVGGLEKVISPILAYVKPGSPSWEVGLRSGDKITALNGKAVLRWQEEFLTEIGKQAGAPVALSYVRKGQPYQVEVIPEKEEGWNLFCEKIEIGALKGISIRAAAAVVGITDPLSWGAHSGFQTGDQIVSLNSVPIDYWYQIEDYLAHIAQTDLVFEVRRGAQDLHLSVPIPPEYMMMTDVQKKKFLGLHSYEFFVREPFKPNTAGAEAGLKVGDRLVSINDQGIEGWDEFRNQVQKLGESPGYFDLTYDRGGELKTVKVIPKPGASQHPCEQDKKAYQIGIMIDVDHIYPPLNLETFREKNPFRALYSASSKSFFMMYLVAKSIVKMFQGKVSLRSMGGPILIGKVAGDHLKQGLLPFLALLAAISINLAILNLLPIPVLDGGHLMFFFYEAIVGKRLSDRVMELAHRAGLVVILTLVVFAFYNDLSRYWQGIIGFFRRIAGLA